MREAEKVMQEAPADVRAEARRACFAFPDPRQSLITERTIGQLTRETEHTLIADEARLEEYLRKRARRT